MNQQNARREAVGLREVHDLENVSGGALPMTPLMTTRKVAFFSRSSSFFRKGCKVFAVTFSA